MVGDSSIGILKIPAAFLISPKWEQPKCPLTNGLNSMWYIGTMEYYSAIKNSKVFIHAITCVNLKTLCVVKEIRHKRLHL